MLGNCRHRIGIRSGEDRLERLAWSFIGTHESLVSPTAPVLTGVRRIRPDR
jgi:hypothetical protein